MSKLGLMKGHLLVAQELLNQNQPKQAEPHIGHPVEEIYVDVEDQLNERKVKEFKTTLERRRRPDRRAFEQIHRLREERRARRRQRDGDLRAGIRPLARATRASASGATAPCSSRIARPGWAACRKMAKLIVPATVAGAPPGPAGTA